MRGVTTQVSDLKSSTACITVFKNNPDTRGATPFLLRMHNILLQTVLAQDKFFTTAGQSFSAAKIIRPRYFNEVTISRGLPWVMKFLLVTSLSSSATNHCIFRSAPRLQCAVCLCVPFRAFLGTSMSHRIWL